jgi:hypothetical protein
MTNNNQHNKGVSQQPNNKQQATAATKASIFELKTRQLRDELKRVVPETS